MVDVCGVILNKRKPREESKLSHTFVYSDTTERNLSKLALAVSQSHPVLLEGGNGVGKTAIIEEISRLTGNDGDDDDDDGD